MRPIADIWKDFYDTLSLLRIQALITVLALIILLVPGQILEIYTVMANDLGAVWLQLIMTFLGIGFFTLMSWYSGRRVTLFRDIDTLNGQDGSPLKQKFMKLMPRVLSILPAGSLAIIWLVHPQFASFDGANISKTIFRWSGGILLVATGIFYVFVTYRTNLASFLQLGPSHFSAADQESSSTHYGKGDRTIRFIYITAVALPVFVFIAVLCAPVTFLQEMGSVFFITVFLGALAFYLSAAQRVYMEHNIPVTFIVILVALTWSALDWNDNHKVRTKTVDPENQKLPQAFENWLDKRKDHDHYTNKETGYPVYIIAAEGGGIYAAHHAAVWLARMQDICPSFAQHVFAISGISGGSVGASVFSGLLGANLPGGIKPTQNQNYQHCLNITDEEEKTEGGMYERHADSVLTADLLSPLVAATLSKDFIQRFLPIPVGPFDRARALEDALVKGWEKADFDRTLMTRPMVHSWSPDGVFPALVLNTTRVDTGERVVAAPFSMKWNSNEIRSVGHYGQPGQDVSVRTAAVLSARFPLVTPAGWVPGNPDIDKGHKIRLVDGGYFENSGVDTAVDIWDAIRHKAHAKGAKIRIISLSHRSRPSEPSYGFGEVMSPITTLLATRGHRGKLALERAKSRLAGACTDDDMTTARCDQHMDLADPVRVSFIHDYDGKLPLGWLLSEANRDVIRSQIGWPNECVLNAGKIPDELDSPSTFLNWNSCILRSVQYELENGVEPAK